MRPDQQERYSRHLLMPTVGTEGQEKLLRARVLLVGAGGLGSPAALYLAAAGVGTLGIVDFDIVDMSNLQRQVLHGTSTVGKPKLESARARINDLNPDVKVIAHETRLTSANAMEIVRDYDIVVDGSDNFATRYLTNDVCVFLKKANIYGSVYQFEGQVSVFMAGAGPCYRCLFPEPPPPGAVPSCAEAGVLGVLPGTIGLIQGTEAIKLILGHGNPLIGRLLLYDAGEMEFRMIHIKRNPACPVCGDNPTITQLIDYEQFCNAGASQAEGTGLDEVTVEELKQRLETDSDTVLLDVRNRNEYDAGHIDGSRLIPLPEFDQRLGELEPFRGREIFIHCQMGGRSAKACGKLKQAGFDRVYNVRGGYAEWQKLKGGS